MNDGCLISTGALISGALLAGCIYPTGHCVHDLPGFDPAYCMLSTTSSGSSTTSVEPTVETGDRETAPTASDAEGVLPEPTTGMGDPTTTPSSTSAGTSTGLPSTTTSAPPDGDGSGTSASSSETGTSSGDSVGATDGTSTTGDAVCAPCGLERDPVLRYQLDGSLANSGTLGSAFDAQAMNPVYVMGLDDDDSALELHGIPDTELVLPGAAALITGIDEFTVIVRFFWGPQAIFPDSLLDTQDGKIHGIDIFNGWIGGFHACATTAAMWLSGGCTDIAPKEEYGWHVLAFTHSKLDCQPGSCIDLYFDGAPLTTIAAGAGTFFTPHPDVQDLVWALSGLNNQPVEVSHYVIDEIRVYDYGLEMCDFCADGLLHSVVPGRAAAYAWRP